MQQPAGLTELAHLQSTMQSIELACSSIQMHMNPAAAEATILSLNQSPQPYKACQFILENSQVPNARFQAAAAIRDAAIREWSSLTGDDKRSLISFCLCYAIQRASSLEVYVQAKVSSVAAQLVKRGWVDLAAAEKDNILYQVNQAVLGVHGVDGQFAGIHFLESLVSEFSPSTSSAMGLPREFHEQCRKSLELDYLKTFYQWAQEAAVRVTKRIAESDTNVPEAMVCIAALRLMLQILNWEFRYNTTSSKAGINVFSSGVTADCSSPKRSECILVQPGPAWQDVLILSGHVAWLLGFYAAVREKFSRGVYWLDCPLAVSARKLIVQLCSLTGTVFHSNSEQMQEHHLVQLLSGIIHWMDPPEAVSQAIECGKSESEMLDGCRALLSMATVTTPVVFDRLMKSIRPCGTFKFLSILMCEVVKALMSNNTDEEPWSWVARDILLDTWAATLLSMNNIGVDALLPPEGRDAAATLFAFIVASELRAASASAMDDDDDANHPQASISAMDERLSSYALIARAAVDVTVPLLTRLFSERLAILQQGRGVVDPTRILEELYSLLLITGHVLADEGEGETPLVPNSIQTRFLDILDGDQHPVVILSVSIISFAEQSLQPEMRASFFSPRLMESMCDELLKYCSFYENIYGSCACPPYEAVTWFLARWSRTYLMPEEIGHGTLNPGHNQEPQLQQLQSRRALYNYFGEYNQGKHLLDIIVRVSVTTILSYPGEKYLQELTCHQLLHTLVRRKNIRLCLSRLLSWRELANAFANENTLFQLSSYNQRSLARTVVLSASGMSNPETSNQYVRDLMGRMTNYLLQLSFKSDLKIVAQQPDVILYVSCLLERLRGAASAAEPRTQRALYEMGVSVMKPILVLLEVYKHESAVIYLLLKFVVVWVDGQIAYLESQDTASIIDFCMRLLKLYSSHNIGKKKLCNKLITQSINSLKIINESRAQDVVHGCSNHSNFLKETSISVSRSLLNETNTEKYKDLRALLQLLGHLCSKDMIDFSADPVDTPGINIAQVVYYGLHIITPLISLELLKYPKFCTDYFTLISHLIEVYPEAVAQLNNEAFANVVGTLDFGLRHQDPDIVEMCLRSLKALASYHYKETGTGNKGLGSHATGIKDPHGNLQEGIFCRFLRLLLQFLLFEDYSPDIVSPAAEALLPLILCEQGLYQSLVNELIQKQADPEYQRRLVTAFQSLTSANKLTSAIDRMNYQRFRKNVISFLIDVRGFLRTK